MATRTYRTARIDKGGGVYRHQVVAVESDGTQMRLLTEFETEAEALLAGHALGQLDAAREAALRIGPANEP